MIVAASIWFIGFVAALAVMASGRVGRADGARLDAADVSLLLSASICWPIILVGIGALALGNDDR